MVMAVTKKQAAVELIQQMDDDASLEDIMYELYFRQRIDRGLEQLERGETVTHAEVKRSVSQWLRSTGR
jgi:predicted transcriptional regulator